MSLYSEEKTKPKTPEGLKAVVANSTRFHTSATPPLNKEQSQIPQKCGSCDCSSSVKPTNHDADLNLRVLHQIWNLLLLLVALHMMT